MARDQAHHRALVLRGVRTRVILAAMRGTIFIGLVTVAGALLACRAKLSGSINIDSAGFTVDSCRSGQANMPKFSGVDFMDSAGRRVRFVALPSGSVRTFIFDPGAKRGTLIGENCGSMNVTEQNSEVNDVKNVQGTLTADCTGSGHHVVATMNFKNCH